MKSFSDSRRRRFLRTTCRYPSSTTSEVLTSLSYSNVIRPRVFVALRLRKDLLLLRYFVRPKTNIPCLKNSLWFESDTDAMYQTTGRNEDLR